MPANQTSEREFPGTNPVVSVIVPARNEEASLGTCLRSLASQSGVEFEVIVVDDHSTDRTRAIAASFAAAPDSTLHVVEAGPLPTGWTGKNNAVVTGVLVARGEWLMFTDADTVHLQGSLAQALAEAREHQVDMLSYSPEQIAVTFWEMAVLPVVFAELAREYPPSKVSDPNSPAAAANGQYILVNREVYEAIGGHTAVAGEILEDVALARRFKAAGNKIRFRYAADAVRTRMYRNWKQLRDGWTKNLALLFPRPGWLAATTLTRWSILLIVVLLVLADRSRSWRGGAAAFLVAYFAYLATHFGSDNFGWRKNCVCVLFGMPMFAYLLLRSKRAHTKGNVPWKGRTYSDNLATGH